MKLYEIVGLSLGAFSYSLYFTLQNSMFKNKMDY